MNSSGGSTVGVRFTKDGAAIATTCTVVGVTEHLVVLELDADHAGTDAGTNAGTASDLASLVPNLGAMVDLEIGRRSYRSTVQHTEAGGFTVLRPRELDHLDGRLDLALLDER